MLGTQPRCATRGLGQLGLLAYEQGDFEKALIYMIKAFILFDTLRSPYRTETQSMIARIRSHIDEDTFMTYWRTFAGDRPLVTVAEQEETAETDEDDTLAVEELLAAVSSIIQQGTVEQRQQFAANLVEAQQQLPVDQTPLGRFVGCLVAVLREETPEVAQLVPPFSELWQIFQEHFRISPNGSSQQKEGKDD